MILLLLTGAALLHRYLSSRVALREFDETARTLAGLSETDAVDFTLWSPKRVEEYHKSLLIQKSLPLAVLEFERLNLRVPVFEGTDELTLNRGAGWIIGTARPGDPGNIGIAAHRDGFFRSLKDVSEGEMIELSTVRGTSVYVVDRMEIVNPDNVEVLRPRDRPSLTLVTCYPFYFIGDAPQRFILRAALETPGRRREFQ